MKKKSESFTFKVIKALISLHIGHQSIGKKHHHLCNLPLGPSAVTSLVYFETKSRGLLSENDIRLSPPSFQRLRTLVLLEVASQLSLTCLGPIHNWPPSCFFTERVVNPVIHSVNPSGVLALGKAERGCSGGLEKVGEAAFTFLNLRGL